jgi:uncharacterized membrane protein
MKNFLRLIKSTLASGLMFLIPSILLIYLIINVIKIFRKLIAPVADRITISFFGEQLTSRILATLLFIFLCFIIGLIARRKKTSPIKDWVEDNILVNIPGYTFLKGITETAAGLESKNLKEVVLVNLEEVWQIGFLMDRIDEDLNVVFIPGAANPLAGDIVYVKWNKLQKLDIDDISVMKIYRKLGVDSGKMLAGKIDKSIFDKKS